MIEKQGKGDNFIDCTGANIRISSLKLIQHDAVEGIISKYKSILTLLVKNLPQHYFNMFKMPKGVKMYADVNMYVIPYQFKSLRNAMTKTDTVTLKNKNSKISKTLLCSSVSAYTSIIA